MTYETMYAYIAEKEPLCVAHDTIADDLFTKYGVNRGLRDQNGKGVLTGLTTISDVVSFREENGERIPIDGELWYRGYNIKTLISNLDGEYGFEKTAYLLIFGEMPDKTELENFKRILSACRRLPNSFTRDVIMKAPTQDIMNSMTRSILTLASYDKATNSGVLADSIRQCLFLLSVFPMLAVYGYHAYNHYRNYASMYIHRPNPQLSTAENFLYMLRPDGKYTELEAKVLDVALMLHMEHGGGNNSTFTTRVITSSGSDTYSTMAAAMSSLKGPRHGGANIKVMEMMRNIRDNVSDTSNRAELRDYLSKILDKKAFDRKGLIYGLGHAVYSISDPREGVLKSYVERLAEAKGREKDLELYRNIEQLGPELIAEKRKIFKGVSPNVDFYSGFVYEMLGIPQELFTPLFAIARIAGWSAHRIEEIVGAGKIIRPAYKSIMEKCE